MSCPQMRPSPPLAHSRSPKTFTSSVLTSWPHMAMGTGSPGWSPKLQGVVWAAVQRLRPEHREVLVLRDYQDLAYSEIAATLGIPRGTVMSRLHRARLRLCELVAHSVGGGEGGDHA